jgi:Cu-processing system permease protein
MNGVFAVARNELRDAVGSTWLVTYTIVFTLVALGLSYLGERNLGAVGFENFSRTTASLLNLCLLLAPLVALLLGSGAVSGERERGTLTYLLAQPLERWELLLGKYAGLSLAVAAATTMGFGLAGIWIAVMTTSMAVGTYLLLLGLVLALIFVMTGIGLIASVVSKTRVQALGMVLMVWIVAVFVFDLVLIGAVSTTSLGGGGLLTALLLNPVEIVRVLAIIHLEPDLQILGPFGSYILERAGVGGATAILVAALLAWVTAPVALAAQLFASREE